MLSVTAFFKTLRAHIQDVTEKGQGLAEYGLILALVAIACVVALTGLGTAIGSTLTSLSGHI